MQSKWKIKLRKLWTSCLVGVLFENEGKRWDKFSVSQENFWWVKCGPKIRETYGRTGLMTISNQFCDLAPKWRHEMLTYFKDGYKPQNLSILWENNNISLKTGILNSKLELLGKKELVKNSFYDNFFGLFRFVSMQNTHVIIVQPKYISPNRMLFKPNAISNYFVLILLFLWEVKSKFTYSQQSQAGTEMD